MKTKKIKYFFFSIILFLIILIPISSFSPFANAQITPTVNVDILSVSLDNFKDDVTPDDGSGKISSSSGGYDFLEFENYGIYSSNNETGEVVVYGRAKLGFETNIWTGCIYNDIYPNINIERERTVPYFQIDYYKFSGIAIIPWVYDGTGFANIKFRDIDFGDTYHRHNYDGIIPITVGIDPGLKFSGGMQIGQQTFTVPSLTSDIIRVENTEVRGGDIGFYDDIYVMSGLSLETTTVELEVSRDVQFDSTQEIAEWINEGNVGLRGYSNITDDSQSSVQQSVIDKSKIGTISPNGINEQFTFNLPIHLQPEVWKTRQTIEYIHAYVKYYQTTGLITQATIIDTYTERAVSVHVQNVFEHREFEVEVDLFMTCDFDGQLSESFLEDPNLVISDMIWDVSLFGDKVYKAVLTSMPFGLSWWMILLIIIFVSAGLYIGYKMYKKKSERKFYLQLAGRKQK